ncbi:uncharacterized protein LY89DRAFT_503172 [Mollisia scopiformis]|uniref:Uncharacterized protein n=1 Tax=Mollisia scopiformis TaxID=149040 RepID=A0A194XEX4_MOLSC|nr:uncharacterized protein LY89DRAFT_503172 [Mollisia scopiformis]KUJ18718.1 hypothetical protein LY89DRAFT_503172 [Mollisia scopiformis]
MSSLVFIISLIIDVSLSVLAHQISAPAPRNHSTLLVKPSSALSSSLDQLRIALLLCQSLSNTFVFGVSTPYSFLLFRWFAVLLDLRVFRKLRGLRGLRGLCRLYRLCGLCVVQAARVCI